NGADPATSGPLGMYPYAATSERHVAPPKVTQFLAELHGKFDAILTAPITREKARTAFDIAIKEEGTFLDLTALDTTTGARLPTSRTIFPPAGARGPDGAKCKYDGKDEVPRGEPLGHGQYAIHSDNEVILPYLPDPNAKAFALHGLPSG